jgi:hypothetical protein
VLIGKRRTNARNGLRRMLEHERRFEPEHPIAEARELAIPSRIRSAATRVVKPVHFHHELCGGGDEIDD